MSDEQTNETNAQPEERMPMNADLLTAALEWSKMARGRVMVAVNQIRERKQGGIEGSGHLIIGDPKVDQLLQAAGFELLMWQTIVQTLSDRLQAEQASE